jgi:hypothetical protein
MRASARELLVLLFLGRFFLGRHDEVSSVEIFIFP